MSNINTETLQKWLAMITTVGVLTWGAMAYYVQAEDTKTRLTIESQLQSIQATLRIQTTLMSEVKDLKVNVHDIQVEMARRQK